MRKKEGGDERERGRKSWSGGDTVGDGRWGKRKRRVEGGGGWEDGGEGMTSGSCRSEGHRVASRIIYINCTSCSSSLEVKFLLQAI